MPTPESKEQRAMTKSANFLETFKLKILIENHSLCFLDQLYILSEFLLHIFHTAQSFHGFLKLSRIGFYFIQPFRNTFSHIPQHNKLNDQTPQKRIKSPGLPKAIQQPVHLLFFFFGLKLDYKAIRTGRNKRFSAVFSFVENKEMRI